jgi:4-hydroxybenzoate polyprenyltransferase
LFRGGPYFLFFLYLSNLVLLAQNKKISRYRNLTAAILAVVPFFAILLHYYFNLSFEEIESYNLAVIFSHASFLFLLLLVREMIKDLENMKGDLANDYKTIQ